MFVQQGAGFTVGMASRAMSSSTLGLRGMKKGTLPGAAFVCQLGSGKSMGASAREVRQAPHVGTSQGRTGTSRVAGLGSSWTWSSGARRSLVFEFGFGGAASGARGFRASGVARKQDLYGLLGVPKDASAADIKKAYFKQAKKFHPDVNKEDGAKEKFAEINKAYEILSDDQKRQTYDMGGLDEHGNENGFGGFGGFGGAQGFHSGNAEDIFKGFEEMFGGGGDMFGGGRRSSRRQGADVAIQMNLSFMDAAKGCTKQVEVPMKVECTTCSGTGCSPGSSSRTCTYCSGKGETIASQMGGMFQVRQQCGPCKGTGQIIEKPCTKCRAQGKVQGNKTITVDIPAGMDDTVRLRVANQGEPGSQGQPSGSVIVTVNITPHPFFSREGNTLYVTMPISVSMAILGGEIEVPTIDGKTKVMLSPGTQPNSQKIVRAKGLQSLENGSYGDLVVTFKVVVPQSLSTRQREVLEAFKAEEVQPSGAEPNPRGGRRQSY